MLKISHACCFGLAYLQPFRRYSRLKCALQPKIAKNHPNLSFGDSKSFKVIDVDKSTGCGKKSGPLIFFAVFSATVWDFNTKFYSFIY